MKAKCLAAKKGNSRTKVSSAKADECSKFWFIKKANEKEKDRKSIKNLVIS